MKSYSVLSGVIVAACLSLAFAATLAYGRSFRGIIVPADNDFGVLVSKQDRLFVNVPDSTLGNIGQSPLKPAVSFHFKRINFPEPGPVNTQAYGINDKGQIVGGFGDSSGSHGFLDTQNNFTALDVPGAAGSTTAFGINSNGLIVGWHLAYGRRHGFLYNQGAFTTLDFPGAFHTEALGINGQEQIVGYYALSGSSFFHGFVYTLGTFTPLDFPGSTSTIPSGINSAGKIVGGYSAGKGSHAFIFKEGEFFSINVPGSTSAGFDDINDNDDIVGNSPEGSFLCKDGVFTKITVPKAGASNVSGINIDDDIVGTFIIFEHCNPCESQGYLAVPNRNASLR